jgi:four helix bundle protein
MPTIKCFEELDIWQKARMFSGNIIRITNSAKFSPDFRLISRIRASSGSVTDNIAEGLERSANKEFIRFLYIAEGSCGESRSQLYRALDSGYIRDDEFNTLKEEAVALSQNISNFIKYLLHSEMKGSKYNH